MTTENIMHLGTLGMLVGFSLVIAAAIKYNQGHTRKSGWFGFPGLAIFLIGMLVFTASMGNLNSEDHTPVTTEKQSTSLSV